jgi:glyoxylase-like metal-dependent hydrolase (beta-lactamase superfamily II)
MKFDFESSLGFRVRSFSVGRLQCNCSLVWDPTSKEAILVDPGDEAAKIKTAIAHEGLQVKAIVHTHAHFDHVGASAEMAASTQAPLYLHPEDRFLWENLPMQGQLFGMKLEPLPSWSADLSDEQTIKFGRFELKTLFTPGHTPGSCCFSINEILFSGDTLFRGSVGRTDLWGGDFDTISKSIKSRLYSLDQDTTVICGHGENTQVGVERRSNPFITA